MNLNPRIPIAVRIVAWLFLFGGWSSVIGMALQVLHRNINLDLFGILSIFAGLGLLRLSNGWRWYSLFVAGCQFLVGVTLLFAVGGHAWKEQWTFLGLYPMWVPRAERLLLVSLLLAISAFQFAVLLAPSVRARFRFKPVAA